MRVTAETKEATRQRILDAGRRLFAEKGFEGTTTRDLAAAAGIASGTLFNYFPTKERLAAELAADALADGRREWAARRRAGESLVEILFDHVAVSLRHLAPFRDALRPILETTLTPLASAAGSEDAAERLRLDHLETVTRLLDEHDLGAPAGGAVTMHLYWSLFLGILGHWAADRSPGGQDTLALIDHAMRVFVASLAGTADEPRESSDATETH